jgi:predicted component of type VI protein secretion system
MRLVWAGVVAVVVVVSAAGCGESGANLRLTKLEQRVTALERENAQLRREQASLSDRVINLAKNQLLLQIQIPALKANDKALYAGVAMAQDGLVCSFDPKCHVPLGTAGAVYTDVGKPDRIFATPFP